MGSHRRLRLTALVAIACVTTSACVTDPYVRWPRPEVVAGSDITLAQALSYARAAQGAYKDQLSRRAQNDAAVEAGLITLAAVALGLGAADAHRDAFVGVGLLGGTTYSLSAWFRNRPQELAYLAGIKAIDCAVTAVEPYVVPTGSRRQLSGDLEALRFALESAAEALGRATVAVAQQPESSGKNAENTFVGAARATIEAAEGKLLQGQRLAIDIDAAGPHLIEAVDQIGNKVDAAVHDKLPELAALPGVIRQLAQSSALVVPGLSLGFNQKSLESPFTPQAREPGFDTKELKPSPLEDLAMKVETARHLAVRVAGFAALIEDKRPLQRLQECGVEIVPPMSVSPEKIEVIQGQASSRVLRVRKGKPPYSATLLEGIVDGITVTAPLPGDSSFTVSVAATSVEGDYGILVSDASGAEFTTLLKVQKKSEEKSGSSEGNTPPPSTVGDNDLKSFATEALTNPISLASGEAVSFRIKVANGQLLLSSDQYGNIECEKEDELQQKIMESSGDDGTTLDEKWKQHGPPLKQKLILQGFNEQCK